MAAMATETVAQNGTSNRRSNVMTGPLSDDFLRLDGQGASPTTAAQMTYPAMFSGLQQSGAVLNITVVEARLAKNYGVTRMDPYCRVRIGVQVFETPTSYNGSKTPRWNKLIQCCIPDTVKEFYIEIFDECTFSVDERIAWGMIKIKDEVFQGEQMCEDWHSLSGKQGDEKEGMINLVIQYKKIQTPVMMPPMGGPMVINPMMYPQPGQMYGGYPAPVMYAPQMFVQPQQQVFQPQPQPQTAECTEKDLQTLKEMCPGLDDEIIKSVFQQSGGNMDQAAAQLLEMSTS